MQEEKTIVIDVKLTKGLTLLLFSILTSATLLFITLTGRDVMAGEEGVSQTQSSGMRQFYLSKDGAYGSTASTACATGYHMASLWEIADPSNLKYNTSLGYVQDDSGAGPPADEAYVVGWIRTGYVSDFSETPGRANCLAWTVHSIYRYGTVASLPSTWTSGIQDLGVWQLDTRECQHPLRVWCVENDLSRW